MTIPSFTPYKNPVLGHALETNFRTLDAGFGDGYSQVTVDGLNATVRAAKNMRWVAMTPTQAASISNQLDGFGGTTFAYQVPGDTLIRYWRCKMYTIDDSDGIYLSLTADFQQVFDLT